MVPEHPYNFMSHMARGASMEMHFRIGEVAEMFDTSIRALRLYDKLGLFKPEFINKETGYRYYTADQLPLLNTILVFKAIGVKLVEIKHLVDAGLNPEDLTAVMRKKQEYWEGQIEIANFNLENICKIMTAASTKFDQAGRDEDKRMNAYKMARLVCLENLKTETLLSEVLWL
jgi:DNA-binding transcriptional MerR regulator